MPDVERKKQAEPHIQTLRLTICNACPSNFNSDDERSLCMAPEKIELPISSLVMLKHNKCPKHHW